MQGYSYTQLYQALQDWPLKKSALYLASLNRMIFEAEKRVILDLDLDIFDVNDSIDIAPGDFAVPKPAGSLPLTFTAGLALGATSGTLNGIWNGTSGPYVVTFSDNELQVVTLTGAATTATWTVPMAAAVTAFARVNSQFIVERSLFSVYNNDDDVPLPKLMVKRSYDFIQNYVGALPGRPRYYADHGQTEWIFGPAADTRAVAINRRYVQRPPSIVVLGNTFIGDNVGQLLFTAALMEAEQFLKADDRYGDMKNKYYGELLPIARGEIRVAMRSGDYAPLQAVATLPQGAPQPQAQQG